MTAEELITDESASQIVKNLSQGIVDIERINAKERVFNEGTNWIQSTAAVLARTSMDGSMITVESSIELFADCISVCAKAAANEMP
jgi:hypothetical protein